MADVSQLTGIPSDRIYKWEKGTKPNDAEDLLKIRAYLEGKLESGGKDNLESVPKNVTAEPSAMQILSVLAEAFKAQAEIMRNIEKNMARADTQATMDANLVRTLTGVEVLNQDSQKLLKLLSEAASTSKAHKAPLSRGDDKKVHQIGGDGKKLGKHRE